MNVGNALGMSPDPRRWRKTDKVCDNNTFVGMEIELENLPDFGHHWINEVTKTSLWTVTNDGSLRNHGLEFIMQTDNKEPLRGGDITRALFRFRKVMKDYMKICSAPSCSERTSLHVHLDVRDLSLSQLQKLILLYSIFEELFFKWADPTRITNNYCRSLTFHSDITQRMARILAIQDDDKGYHMMVNLLENGNKYDACNYLSVRQRGSLEFRLLGGTYDTKVMLSWINKLQALKKAAKDESIVVDSFPEDMSQRGLGNLIGQVFGQWGDDLVDLATELDILRGVRRAQDILLLPRIDNLEEEFATHSSKDRSHLEAFKAKLAEAK